MRVLAAALAVSMLLAASETHAQQAPPRPAGQAPAPAAPRPAAPAPAPAPAAAPAPPPARFQDGLKYAYVRIDRIAAESSEGKVLNERVKALNDQKVRELNEKNKALQSAQQKLDSGGNVLNDTARAQLTAEIERQQRDIQRFTEDAQQDLQALQQQLQEEFTRKLNPVLDKVAKEKQVHMVFNATESGLVWADPTMDLTSDIIKALDSAAPAAAAPAPPAATTKPAAPAAPPRPRRSSAARAVRAGRPAAGAAAGGHSSGAAGAFGLRRRTRFRDHVTAPDAPSSPDLTALLPRHAYRYPARLVDAIVAYEPGRRLVAIKQVTVNEEFFQGHFPGLPLMPAVLQIESLTQAAVGAGARALRPADGPGGAARHHRREVPARRRARRPAPARADAPADARAAGNRAGRGLRRQRRRGRGHAAAGRRSRARGGASHRDRARRAPESAGDRSSGRTA